MGSPKSVVYQSVQNQSILTIRTRAFAVDAFNFAAAAACNRRILASCVIFQQPRPSANGFSSLLIFRSTKFSFCGHAGDKKAEQTMKSFARRDRLKEIESKVQKLWEDAGVFRADAKDLPPKKGDKFFGNFPFPYMNGYLHLGHAFTLSKLEFAAAYHRLRGANVLLPFAFHCTGMPIKVAADKLQREIKMFGCPPVFPVEKEKEGAELERMEGENVSNTKGRKSKVLANSSGVKYQWKIMQSIGLSDEKILKFTDPYHWLTFFPRRAVDDLKAFGLGCDWRRTFITTDMNPYFDSFVRWQMRKLKSMGRIINDLRYTIFSPLDGQPCGDHDRASGEGVIPQEYTLVKMEVVSPLPPKMSVLEGKRVYLTAATLRPETMYGQTNCWVLPNGKYGAFEVNDSDVFILTKRAALNLAYQKLSRVPKKPTCLVELTGQDLVGLPVRSPLAFYDIIYTLPMLSVLTDKGTGIVASVPSDSLTDYKAFQDNLKSNSALRKQLHLKDEWVLPFEIIPIIHHPDSTMLVGDFAGMKVKDAKTLIRSKLLERGQAVVYCEPEKKVVSRSGDECVVALTDQWFITYGEPEWRKVAEECLSSMKLYSDDTRHVFEHSLSWLNQWACSRNFGLGTCIPWDEDLLVESLSDSTLYMVYYTVAHLLQRGDMYGNYNDKSVVKPEHLTDEVWDFLFVDGPYPKSSDIPSSLLNEMKREFEYWYPFDLRVSGKDLIQNHLTFCIYNHTAIMPKRHWPRGFRCNGHIVLNNQKMSKSTGNFMTLRQAIEQFSADATRFALADAGDGMDDPNFVFKTADKASSYLVNEISWMEDVRKDESSLRRGPPSTFGDRVFANEMDIAVTMTAKNYSQYMFHDALKTGFHVLQDAKGQYRTSCESRGEMMNRELVWRFMDVQTRLIAPICPHYSEYVWKEVLHMDGFVVKAGWPHANMPDVTLDRAKIYMKDSIDSMRKLLEKQTKDKPSVGLIFVNEQYDGLRKDCLLVLKNKFDPATLTFAPDEEILLELRKSASWQQEGNLKKKMEVCMPFLRFKKNEVKILGIQALDLKLPFSEIEVLKDNLELIKQRLEQLGHLEVVSASDADAVARAGSSATLLKANPPSPGKPTAIFLNPLLTNQ